MTDLRKAAEMALEALEWKESYLRKLTWKHESVTDAAKALRQALAQEWVCCVCGDPKALGIVHSADAPCFHYTKREWVGLTDEDLEPMCDDWRIVFGSYVYDFAKAIEAKLKEKNT